MLDKSIIVFYINVGNLDHEGVSGMIKKVQDMIKPLPEDAVKVIQYVIPVRDQETKIECINSPVYFSSEDQVKKYKDEIKRMDDKLDRITSTINAKNETRSVLSEKFNEYIA